jgi:hypothetical protein
MWRKGRRDMSVSECMCDQNNLHEVINGYDPSLLQPHIMKSSLVNDEIIYVSDGWFSEDYLYM